MATTKNARKTPRSTGRGEKDPEIDTSAPASGEDNPGAGEEGEETQPVTGEGTRGKGDKAVKGDPTGQSGEIINTGAKSLPGENRQAPRARDVADPKAKTQKLFLDQPYMLHGRVYPASQHPDDLVTVPEDFPTHILPNEGEAPTAEEWTAKVRGTPPSAVIEVSDESGKAL